MTFTWTVRMDGTDIAGLTIEGATIDYGRASLFDQPGGPVAVLELLTKDAFPDYTGQWPEFDLGGWSMPSHYVEPYADIYVGATSRLVIGAPVEIQADTTSHYTEPYIDTFEGASLRRFTGKVQAIDYTPGLIQVTCTTQAESWGRQLVGGTDNSTTIPSETDVARVQRFCTEAGATIQIDGPPGPTLCPIPPKTEARPLIEQLRDIAQDTLGLIYVDRDNVVHYRTGAEIPANVTQLPPGAVLVDPIRMSLDLALVRTRVLVTYGEEHATTKERPVEVVEDTAQSALYGVRDYKVDTQLLNQADAHAFGLAVLSWLDPAWNMPSIAVRLDLATDPQIADIAAVEQGELLEATALLSGAPVPTYTAPCLGYTETLSADDWAIEYHLAPNAEHTGSTP